MPTFFLVSSSFVLAFTLVLAHSNESLILMPRSLTLRKIYNTKPDAPTC